MIVSDTERSMLSPRGMHALKLTPYVAAEVAKNIAMGIPAIARRRTALGRTALPPSSELLQRYAYDHLDEVLRHTGPVAGKSVLEIGPGDNLVTGLAFLAAGAASYTALDRFPGAYDDNTARQWYALLKADWPRKYPDLLWPAGLDSFPNDPRVSVMREGVETATSIPRFDLVTSYAVGEHVQDVRAFADLTRCALKPNGVAMHAIDMGGHDWDRFGDPFLFLRFPEWLWQAMGSNRGTPNRVRIEGWLEAFSCLDTEVVHRKDVKGQAMGAVFRLRPHQDAHVERMDGNRAATAE